MMSISLVRAGFFASLATVVADQDAAVNVALTSDNECAGSDDAECTLNALQQSVLKSSIVEAYDESVTGSCSAYGCGSFQKHRSCQCNDRCHHYNSCCSDYDDKCKPRDHSSPAQGGNSGNSGGGSHVLDAQTVSAKDGIEPPKTAMAYKGMAWPTMNVSVPAGTESHIFAIGDWGGMDGTFQPPDGFPRMVAYPGGAAPGPHVFPRSRIKCKHQALVDCYFPHKYCDPECGFDPEQDLKPQVLVATAFRERAAKNDPQYILNVGDNFYWGGIAMNCGSPMNQVAHPTVNQFKNVFESQYYGPGIDGKRWLTVLGNHDWGGRMFSAAWDQQIAYTWASDRWMLPAPYWSQLVEYPDYSVEVFMVDSNFNDATAFHKDIEHNICGSHNVPNADCAAADGPASVKECQGFFHGLWDEQQPWLEKKLAASTADWQISVTHFPCDHQPKFWKQMHYSQGLDLLVTGHRHDQELWKPNQRGYKGLLGSLTCFVTGGGGGITSEESPLPGKPTHNWPNVEAQYGFFDITVSKEAMSIESILFDGKVIDHTDVIKKERR